VRTYSCVNYCTLRLLQLKILDTLGPDFGRLESVRPVVALTKTTVGVVCIIVIAKLSSNIVKCSNINVSGSGLMYS